MNIKTSLYFRECKPYLSQKGEKKLRVRFLDDQDKDITIFINDEQKNEKFKQAKKDQLFDLDFSIYKLPSGDYGLYYRG